VDEAATGNRRKRREALLVAHEQAENRGDVEATLATFGRSCCYDVTPGGIFDGPEAVRGLLKGIFTAIPDFHATTVRLYHADDAVIVETRTTGTHTGGDFFGMPPRGRRLDMRAISIYEFDGDEMTCERLFFDGALLQQQLAGGAPLEADS